MSETMRKPLAIHVERKPVKDLFDLAFRAKQQAKRILGHDRFTVLPTVHYDEQYKCYIVLVQYTAPERRTRSLAEVMTALSKKA
jgi:hypothetical protein